MIATFANQTDTLATIAGQTAGKCEADIPSAREDDGIAEPVEEIGKSRDSFLDYLRRALAVPHV